jgi:hypothetical protein
MPTVTLSYGPTATVNRGISRDVFGRTASAPAQSRHENVVIATDEGVGCRLSVGLVPARDGIHRPEQGEGRDGGVARFEHALAHALLDHRMKCGVDVTFRALQALARVRGERSNSPIMVLATLSSAEISSMRVAE